MTHIDLNHGGQRPGGELERRVATTLEEIRRTLLAAIRAIAGPSLRPSRLVVQLKLDKSLASRLVRAVRAETDSEFLHFLPSPTGLRIFLDAASEGASDPDVFTEARAASDRFRELIEEFPGGRSALDTWASRGPTPARNRTEHAARQAVYRAMSQLLGFHCEVVTSALILQPGEDGRTVDGVELSHRAGVRRIRPDTPIALFSIDLASGAPGGPDPHLAPLSTQDDPSNPASYLVPRFCDPETPALDIHRAGTHHVFALSDALASVHRPVTVTSAMVVRSGWARHGGAGQSEDGRNYLLHYPCKLLVRDLFIRDDLYLGSEPTVRFEFPAPGAAPAPVGNTLPRRLNTLEMWAPIEHLGLGTQRWSVPDVSSHAGLLAHAFGTLGWEPSRFRGYRARVAYPVPMILLSWKIPLPPAP